jgi:hypothetical protein
MTQSRCGKDADYLDKSGAARGGTARARRGHRRGRTSCAASGGASRVIAGLLEGGGALVSAERVALDRKGCLREAGNMSCRWGAAIIIVLRGGILSFEHRRQAAAETIRPQALGK